MKKKHLFGAACLLLAGLASCTSDELVPNDGGINGQVPGEGAVVFSLEGLGSGSVENPGTRAILASQEENRIDSLDIYVFAYDNDGTFNEDLTDTNAGVIAGLTPDDPATADNALWYLQEKWTWKNPEAGRSSGVVDTSLPQLHEIAALGGSGVARTAVIYPQKGRFLKFFIVANGGELTATATDAVFTPVFTDSRAQPAPVVGTRAADFLNLRLRLGGRPADATQVRSIECPLPMTAQMATTAANAVDMTAAASPVQVTRGATLTRAVTRFDVVNYAALPSQGDYTLTDIIVSNHYAFTNLQNLVPAGTPMLGSVRKSLEGRAWSNYTDPVNNERAMQLQSVFYTSPTLAGTDPMKLGLRGVLGATTAPPGELLTPLNKDVDVVDAAGNPIVLQANYRYLLKISKLGSDINVIFSILDWDSKILDADFSNAPTPMLIWQNAAGITWDVTSPDMNLHAVTMDNTAVGGRLAFELGTYSADELADLLIDPTNPAKIPFAANVVSLNDNPAYPEDNIWLATPVITYDAIKRDRFNVVLDIRPESEVPLHVRPDLMVTISNKEHAEKRLFFRVTSTWTAPDRPLNAPVTIGAVTVTPNNNPAVTWAAANAATPAGYALPTAAQVNAMADITLNATPQTISRVRFLQAFPAAGTATWWLADEDGTANAKALVVTGNQASVVSMAKTATAKAYYVQVTTVNGHPATEIGDYVVVPAVPEGEANVNKQGSYDDFAAAAPEGWIMPTKAIVAEMGGIDFDTPIFEGSTMYKVTKTKFFQAFPSGKIMWLADEVPGKPTHAYNITMDESAGIVNLSSQPKDQSYATARYVKLW